MYVCVHVHSIDQGRYYMWRSDCDINLCVVCIIIIQAKTLMARLGLVFPLIRNIGLEVHYIVWSHLL